MKRTKWLLAVVFLVVTGLSIGGCSKKSEGPAPAVKPANVKASSSDYMRVSFIEGEVKMKTADAGDWGYASMNSPIHEGDEFWVPQDGRLELQLKSGTYIRLNHESYIYVLEKDKDSLEFHLAKGSAYVFNKVPEGGMTQVDTVDGVMTRVFDNSIFRVDLSDKNTEVGVYKKQAIVSNKAGNYTVLKDNVVSLGLENEGRVGPMGPPDEWEAWNQLRDEKLSKRGDKKEPGNLPGELTTYASDFDDNGKWMTVPTYGTVWIPTSGVGADWAPYKNGSWVWRDNDYVWVASEQWGWVPYHYGRWAFVEGTGWCWVPPASDDVYWSPGYVGWVKTDDYVAWVPLAPGETYYGRGDYGPHSVNTNIAQGGVPNVYINVQVNNAATVVSRNTFGTASPRIERLDQKLIQQKVFTKNNISVGTPAIKPTRASYYATAKIVPAEKLPPQSVRDLNIKELKQSTHLIKDQNQSAFTPGKPAAQLPVHKVNTPMMRGKSNPPALVGSPEVRGLDGKQKNEKDHNLKVNAVRDQKQLMKQQPGKNEAQGRVGEQNKEKDHKPKVKAVQSLGRNQNQITSQQQGKSEVRKRNVEPNQTAGHTPKVKSVQSLGRNQNQMIGQQAGSADVKGQKSDHTHTTNHTTEMQNRKQNQVQNQQQAAGQQKPADNKKADDKQKKQKGKNGEKDDKK